MNEQQPIPLQIGIARIYVKDLSLESPMAPDVFFKNMKPELKVDFKVSNKDMKAEKYEVTLKVTVEAKEEKNTLFIVEVEQAGLFEIKGPQGDALKQVLGIFCPNQLFPYARQSIDNALNLAGLNPLMLAPINFEALAQQGKGKGTTTN